MFDNKEFITQASNRIDDLLNQGFRVSVVNKDTFYLYSTDKEILGSLTLFKDDKNKSEYGIILDGVPGVKVFRQSGDVYKQLYNYINRKYNFDVSFLEVDKAPFTVDDVRKMWVDMHAAKSADKEKKFLEAFVQILIAHRCPIDYFQRVFYCFEKPNTKKCFCKQFKELNVEDKLVEYKTQRKKQWFLSGENRTGRFLPMDDEARKIFDKVKSALQNQK